MWNSCVINVEIYSFKVLLMNLALLVFLVFTKAYAAQLKDTLTILILAGG